jgi:hypothetical protein
MRFGSLARIRERRWERVVAGLIGNMERQRAPKPKARRGRTREQKVTAAMSGELGALGVDASGPEANGQWVPLGRAQSMLGRLRRADSGR